MAQQSVIHSTFVIERSYPATPESVFAAFADPVKKRRWFLERAGEIDHFELDFRVGGKETSRFRFKEGTPVAGLTCVNDGAYLEIVPNCRIVGTSTMTIAGKLVSASLTTFEFVATGTGTDLLFTHQGVFFEGSGGPEMREDGWRKLLELLAADLHEPETT